MVAPRYHGYSRLRPGGGTACPKVQLQDTQSQNCEVWAPGRGRNELRSHGNISQAPLGSAQEPPGWCLALSTGPVEAKGGQHPLASSRPKGSG